MLPGGKLGKRHAEFNFDTQDFRFTVGENTALYAFCMKVPSSRTQVKIKSLGANEAYVGKPVKKVTLLGYKGKLKWKQEADCLTITCPERMLFETSVVFKVE